MQLDLHPKDYTPTTFVCSCGSETKVRSCAHGQGGKKTIPVDICSECHPFFTGKTSRLLDTAGRIDKFKRKFGEE